MEDIRKNEIAVIKDSLLKKVTLESKDKKRTYLLYFKEYYSRTGKAIKVNRTTYLKSFKDNNYYIVFENKENKDIKIYKTDEQTLDKNIKKYIIDITLLGYYLGDEHLIMMQDNTQKLLNKDDLRKDIINDEVGIIRSLFVLILIFPLFLLFMGIISSKVSLIVIGLILFIVPYIIIWIYSSKKIKISNEINKGKFIIQEDKVDEINKTLDYRSTYRLRTLTFKKYKKEIRVPKKEFLEIKKNDKVYLLLNKKKEVIRCYNAKYVQFDKDLEEYIK